MGCLLLALVIIATLLILRCSRDGFQVHSNVDGKLYTVKKFSNHKDAANALARINLNVVILIRHLKHKYGKQHPLVKNLLDRFNPDVVNEHIPTIIDSDVAYTSNKGKSLHICLRQIYRNKNQLHNINVIMFVALHELSHIATNAKHHVTEFWEVFKFILLEAIEVGIYKAEDYRFIPAIYCNNMKIDYSPLYDNTLSVWSQTNY